MIKLHQEVLNFLNFEKTYKTAYTHGLEAIYALETIDPKSIRTLKTFPQKDEIAVKKEEELSHAWAEEVFEEQLDLGPLYRGWMTSLVIREPISVIGISKHAERCLLEGGKKVLGDLIDQDLSSFIYFKGMGQGHLDEIHYKLQNYLSKKSIYKTARLDFSTWCRTLTVDLDKKKCFVLFDHYGFGEVLSLTAQENIEVKRLTLEMRQEWIEEIRHKIQSDRIKKAVFQTRDECVQALICPWIIARLGIANEDEVRQRLLDLSSDAFQIEKMLLFFNDLYFPQSSLLESAHLIKKEGLFFSDRKALLQYQRIIELATSYFYDPFKVYPFKQLVQWIKQEASLNWEGFVEGFVEKALKLSPHFSVRKTFGQGLIVERVASSK